MSIIKIKTADAGEYIELRARQTIAEEWKSNRDYRAEGYEELVLVSQGRRILWRVDAAVPTGLTAPGDKFSETRSAATGLFRDRELSLGAGEQVVVEFHTSSPLTPLEHGIWTRLIIQFEDGRLVFKKTYGAWRGGYCVEGTPLGIDQSVPGWLQNPAARWVYESRGNSSRGRSLLAWDPAAQRERANLLHIDPANDQAARSFAFSLVLKPSGEIDAYEVCTEFNASLQASAPAVLSGRAMRLSYDERPMGTLLADELRWVCQPRPDRSGWDLDWQGVAGAHQPGRVGMLSLEAWTLQLFSLHALGIASTSAKNRLSFFPGWIRTAGAADVVTLSFSLTCNDRMQLLDTQLRQVRLTAAQQELDLFCAGAATVDGTTTQLRVQATQNDEPVASFSETIFRWTLTVAADEDKDKDEHKDAAGPGFTWGISSVLLDSGRFVQGEIAAGLAAGGAGYRRAPLEALLRLEFAGSSYRALSVDPEIGFETTSASIPRPRPWAVDLVEEGVQHCGLTLRESTHHAQSRQLQIVLRHTQKEKWKVDVVVIDPAPTTLVRIASELDQQADEILAEFLDDGDQAAEWRFFSRQGEVAVTLPPQGIGEEMVKGTLHIGVGEDRRRVPEEDRLFQFRLTPVARLVWDLTDVDMARPEAPWSIRRLLGRRSGSTGVKLDRADFELFYGMAARLEAPGLRIAELDGFVGTVPFPERLSDYLGTDADLALGGYAEQAAAWLGALWHRPSWWRVYGDITRRDRLLVEKGIAYRLRSTRKTANPFAIDQFAVRQDPQLADALPLRGGVDWPFQSDNIYQELLAQPHSSAGSIDNLVFGSLGGEGAQTAAFNNGKTIVITSSRQGRLDSVTLIRIGRIAMLWNKARHVIVYERTTRVAPRYVTKAGEEPEEDSLELQPDFADIAALRKVREYVEITEPRRRYPDHVADRAVNGPLAQSVFGSTVVPVRSDWGRDVPGGFAIALRGPIPEDKALSFPDPNVFLDFARAPGKGEGVIAQRIRSTEKLVFFTSTRSTDGGDTDQWPAWPDIDYPLLRPPRPPSLPFVSSFTGRRRQPDAAPVELGMGPFTFFLEPSEEAPNLMHERPVPGLEARIANINLARGLPPAASSGPKAEVQRASNAFGDAHAQLVDGLAELRDEMRLRARAGQSGALDTDPQFQKDVVGLMARLGQLANLDPPAGVTAPGWDARQSVRNTEYAKGVAAQAQVLQSQLADLAAHLQSAPAPLDALADAALQLARSKAASAIELVRPQAAQRVAEVCSVPRQAMAALERLAQTFLHRCATQALTSRTQLGAHVAGLQQALLAGSLAPGDVQTAWETAVDDLLADVRRLEQGLQQAMDSDLGQWFSRRRSGGEPTIFESLVDALEPVIADALAWLARWAETIAPFDLESDLSVISRDLAAVLDGLVATLGEKLKAFVARELAAVAGWDDAVNAAVGEVDDWANRFGANVAAAATVQEVIEAVQQGATQLVQTLGDGAAAVIGDLNVQLPAFSGIQGSLDALKDFKGETQVALDAIRQAAQQDFAALWDAVDQHVTIVENFAQASGQQIEEWARDTLGPIEQIAKENLNAGLEAVRLLAEGPVTDTIQVSRELLGYYFLGADAKIPLTKASAVFNELADSALNALNACMPFDAIADRLMASIDGMRLGDLLPKFCGIDLTWLLPDLDVGIDMGSHDWIKILHGFDEQRLRAWAKVWIDKTFDGPTVLFDLGPVKLRLISPRFRAQSDITIAKDGTRWQRTEARLDADIELSLNDRPMMTLHEGSIFFDEKGELKFNFDTEKLELAEELKFITDAMALLMPEVEGLAITPVLPIGVSAALSLPLPDIGTGAFTLTGITVNAHLDLVISEGFEIRTGLWVSKPDRPFGLAILFLGGGGWFGIDATFKPPSRFITRVSLGISAGAFIAVNFAVARGSAGLLFTVSVDFYRDWQTGAGTTAISLGLIVWGEFSVLCIASASIRLTMRIEYTDDGGMRGIGTFTASIRICWCYTLRVSQTVEQRFSGSGGQRKKALSARTAATAAGAMSAVAGPQARAALMTQMTADTAALQAEIAGGVNADIEAAIAAYVDMLAIVEDEQ